MQIALGKRRLFIESERTLTEDWKNYEAHPCYKTTENPVEVPPKEELPVKLFLHVDEIKVESLIFGFAALGCFDRIVQRQM